MKKILKWGAIVFVGLIVIGVIASAGKSGSTTPTSGSDNTTQKQEEQAPAKEPEQVTATEIADDFSPTTANVLDGIISLSDLTPTQRQKVTDEMRTLGIFDPIPPEWFRKIQEEQAQMQFTPEALKLQWQKYTAKVTGKKSANNDGDEIDVLIKKYPDNEQQIRQAFDAGYTTEEIEDFLSK